MSTASWLAALLATPLLVCSAAAETVRFRSTTWPPTPLQQRLAKAAGQTIPEQASVELAGELYRPPPDPPSPAGGPPPPCRGRLPPHHPSSDAPPHTALCYTL